MEEIRQRAVFITGSEYEGFGIGILEAMAAGKIVLCRDMAPINGFVERGATGFFLDFDMGEKDLAVIRAATKIMNKDSSSLITAKKPTTSDLRHGGRDPTRS